MEVGNEFNSSVEENKVSSKGSNKYWVPSRKPDDRNKNNPKRKLFNLNTKNIHPKNKKRTVNQMKTINQCKLHRTLNSVTLSETLIKMTAI